MVLSSVGGMITSANLVTVEPTPTKAHQFRFPLELAVRRLQFLLENPTPAPFLTTVLSSVGDMITTANLVTVESNTDKNTPVSVSLGTGRTAVAVSAGRYHTCAILDDGSLKCWGYDYFGQLGDGGTNTDKNTPVSVSLGTGRTAVAVSAGGYHTCAILDDGSLKCWGMIAAANLVTVEATSTKTHLFRFPLERLQIPELLPFLNVI